MNIDEKDLQLRLNQAECAGVMRARRTLSYVHLHKASIEIDPIKKQWHEEEAKRVLDDERWNTVMEQM